MKFKHFHNNGSDIFTLYNFDTEKLICKIKVNRKKNHNLIQAGKNIYKIIAASGGNNSIGVRELKFWAKEPVTLWRKNNLFTCPYCLHTVVRDDDFNRCLICKSLTTTGFVYWTCGMPKLLTTTYEENQLVMKLRARNFKIMIYKEIKPKKRGSVTRYNII